MLNLPSKMSILLIFLLLGVFLPLSSARLSAQIESSIQGTIRDAQTGEPIPNATIILWDAYNYKKQIIWTDALGKYFMNTTQGNLYDLYVYFDDEETAGFDYVPKKSVDIIAGKGVTNLSCNLLPGASVFLDGQIYDIRSKPVRRFFVDVVDPLTGQEPTLGLEDANFTNVYTWGYSKDAGRMGFPRGLVVVPAETLVDLKVSATGLSPRRPPAPVYIEFMVDNKSSHYNLKKGAETSADLSWYSLRNTIGIMSILWDNAWTKLGDMVRAGFYMGDLKAVMRSATSQIEGAEKEWTNGSFQKAFESLSEPYFTITENVNWVMEQMWLIAGSSAVFMPFFPAFFAVTMGFFLFEKFRRKIISSCILYGASFVLLYYVYPGFQVLEARLLLALASSIFFLVLFAVFGLPRLIREPDIPGPYPFRAVLSVVFSMGKRNVKRRLGRGILTIASLTILVLAFTAFTSFGKALGLFTTPISGVQPPSDGVLIKNLPLPWEEIEEPYIRMEPEEVEGYENRSGVTLVSPLVWSLPPQPDQPMGVLRKGEKSFNIFGILGIDPSSEANVTHVNQAVINGKLIDLKAPEAAMISQGAADLLGVGLGDTVSFQVLGFYKNLTVVGVIDPASLSSLIDLDGDPLLPYRKVTTEGGIDYVRAEASEVLVLNWETCLEEDQPLKDITAISRIVVQLSSQEDPNKFARNIVFQEYTVWVSSNGKLTKFYLGESLEIGGFTLLVPLFIVLLNVGLVMISIISERTREIFTLTCVGFNPTHIAALFLAESIVMGLVGGGLGYLLGISSYRLMTFLSVDVAVRQKLEWYWSAIGVLLSVGAAVLSALRPASRAAMKVTPSLVKKVKLESEREKIRREEDIWKVYQAQKVTMPVRIHEGEILFFSSYFSSRLQGMKTGLFEMVKDYSEDEEETPEGDQIRHFLFTYAFLEAGGELVTVNELLARKRSKDDYYSLSLESKPKTPGLPMAFLDRTIRLVRDILGDWEEEKPKLMGKK